MQRKLFHIQAQRDSTHRLHSSRLEGSCPISETNCTTFHTSWKLLARPRLILTTPTSRPNISVTSWRVTPGKSRCIMSCSSGPSMAATPPGLHMQPVRREICLVEAAYSTNEFGSISPKGYKHNEEVSGRQGLGCGNSLPQEILKTLPNPHRFAHQLS